MRDFFGFDPNVIHEKNNLSYKLVDILSFDNSFLETDVAQGMTFKGKRGGIFHNFTMEIKPGYEYLERFRGRISWYMLESGDFIQNIGFK